MNCIKSYCRIVPGRIVLNGDAWFESNGQASESMHAFFSSVYEHLEVDYRKFYKMDLLSKLGFLASELVLNGLDKEQPKEDTGIVLFNSSASLEADKRYQRTIQYKDDFFPSPAEFVYTLPNIVLGEIAIRNKVYGETSFFITPDFQADRITEVIEDMINFAGMKRVLAGWTEIDASSGTLSCFMVLVEMENELINSGMRPLTARVLCDLYG